MRHHLLNTLNAPIFFLLMAIAIAFQTSIFNSYPLLYFQPDIVLLGVIWCALKRSFTEGGILTLLFANLAEIHTGAPQGIYLISYMIIYLGLRASNRYFLLNNLRSWIAVALTCSLLWKALILLILYFLDRADNQWRHTLSLAIPGALVESLLAFWIFPLLEKFDWKTFKDPRSRQVLEEELLLEEEGI